MTNTTKIKICGLRRPKDIEIVNKYKPDFAGFIIDFPKSFRSLEPDKVCNLTKGLDKEIKSVGVFVDEDIETVIGLLNDDAIDIAQLHGHESPEYIKKVQEKTGKKVIKCFMMKSDKTNEVIEKAKNSPADMILLDAGYGSGKTFDWRLICDIGRPFFLAGGLDAENVTQAIKELNPYAVDISSSVETEKYKDEKLVRDIIEKVRWQS